MHISICHTLMPARDWQDRLEFGLLCDWWRKASGGTCALVGIGGAGKTAIVDRFLRSLPGGLLAHPNVPQHESLQAPSEMLVFSFAEGNADEFFRELLLVLCTRAGTEPDASGSYHSALQLMQAGDVSAGKRLLVVLDGLEHVQDDGRREGKFGQITDGRLRDLVLRVAGGWAPNVSLLASSRFRLFDPLAQRSLHYLQIPVERLDESAGIALLRARGVKGTDSELNSIAREQHYHALSLDLIGGYIGTFCDGDPKRVPAMRPVRAEEPEEDPGITALRDQEKRFSEIAQWYRTALAERDPAALALVERVCLFRLGEDAPTISAIFTGDGKQAISGKELASLTQPEVSRKLKQLAAWRLLAADGETEGQETRYQVHAAVREGFLRGLDQAIVRQAHLACMKSFEGILSGHPNSAGFSRQPVDLIEEIIHHAIQAGELKAAMDFYHGRLGGLNRLVHRADAGDLERGRRICVALAGTLVFPEMRPTDRVSYSDLTQTLGEWATYSLELGRLDECVRIRRLQLAEPLPEWGSQGFGSPRRRSEAYAYLAQVLLLQGRIEEAIENVGRGYQIAVRLRDASAAKKVCGFTGEAWGLLGRTEEADACFDNSRYLQNLNEYSYPLSRPGEFDTQPLYSLGGVLLNAHQIRCGLLDAAEKNAQFNLWRMNRMNPASAIIPRIHLVMAAIAMHKGESQEAYHFCGQAFDWAVVRDSYALLCLTALMRAQIGLRLLASGESLAEPGLAETHAACHASLAEGVHIARQCGYGIYHIDLMLQSAHLALLSGDPASALEYIRIAVDAGIQPLSESGRPALLAASDAKCGYTWGIAEGRHRRGEALLLQAAQKLGTRVVDTAERDGIPAEVGRQIDDARAELEQARALRQQIKDPRWPETERAIGELSRGLLTGYPLAPTLHQAGIAEGSSVATDRATTEPYDVFLSHNSKDRPAVRLLAQALKARGLLAWMDEAELIPGRPWQPAIEQLIQVVRSAAVVVGPHGVGPWQEFEKEACVTEFVRRGLPVIPVVLPGAPGDASLPLFLRKFTLVNLRDGFTKEGLDRLERGITDARRVAS